MDLVERRALDVQRRFEEAQEELIIMEHQKEDDKIRLEVALKETDEWRQVKNVMFELEKMIIFHLLSVLN